MRRPTFSPAVSFVVHFITRTCRLVGGVVAVLSIVGAVAIFALAASNTMRLVPVLSNSMAPDMPVGSLALTVPVPRTDITTGDVIVFTNPNHPVVRVIHRIAHIYGPAEAASFTNWSADTLVASTKGDNNPTADPWTLTVADPMIWRMERSVPYLGQPAIWLESAVVRFWAFTAGGVLLILWMLVLVWRRPPTEPVPV